MMVPLPAPSTASVVAAARPAGVRWRGAVAVLGVVTIGIVVGRSLRARAQAAPRALPGPVVIAAPLVDARPPPPPPNDAAVPVALVPVALVPVALVPVASVPVHDGRPPRPRADAALSPTSHAVADHLAAAKAGRRGRRSLVQLAEADAALQLAPGNAHARFLVGDALLASGDAPHGCAELRKAQRWPVARKALAASCPSD